MDKKKVYRNLVILAVVVAFILVITLIIQFVMLGVTSSKNNELTKKVEALKGEITTIEDEIEYKKTLTYIEKYAREQLDLYGKGDIVFVPKS